MKPKFTLIFALLILQPDLTDATEIFIAPPPLGTDTHPGTREQPKADIQQAIWSVKPGDTITLLSGKYTKPFSFAKSGTAEAPITVRSDKDGAAIIDGTALPPAGHEFALVSVSANYVTIEGLTVCNSPAWGISIWGKTNAVIRGNQISGCAQGGITAGFTDTTTVQNVLIEANVLRDNCRVNAEHKTTGGWPASLSVGGTRCSVRGNFIERGHGEGILVGGDQITIEGNVVREHFSAGIYLDNATHCVVRNNFVQQCSEGPYFSAGKAPGYLTDGRSISTGIQLANERPFHNHPNPTADNLIEENTVVGAKAALYYGDYQSGGGIKRTRFERNTFIDSSVELVHLDPSPGHVDNIFASNRCVQTLERPALNLTTVPSGFRFSGNLWLGTPPAADFTK